MSSTVCMLICREREIKENIKGGNVTDVKRFKAREGGNKNTPVLLTLEGNILPARVFIGCLSFLVREYLRPPLRCFKCQRVWTCGSFLQGKQAVC